MARAVEEKEGLIRDVRRRGLKRSYGYTTPLDTSVASRAEAWIETRGNQGPRVAADVASRAEAWIETSGGNKGDPETTVASRAEAWIETASR